MKISLYHFGGQAGLPQELINTHPSDAFTFIDPYPDKEKLESSVCKVSIPYSRCIATPLFQLHTNLPGSIQHALTDLPNNLLDTFISSTSKTLACSLVE